jgi:hypothetical protein
MRDPTPRAVKAGLASLLGALTAAPATAMLTVQALVTPVGGNFEYDITIDNGLSEDVSIVSLVDAPLSDPLIDPTLTSPAGYLASYDDGLGFVDFLEDTSSFAAGTVVAGFSFTSTSGPGAGVFASFEALTVLGDFVSGTVEVTLVPEPGTTLLVALGLLGLALPRGRRHRLPALLGIGLLLTPSPAARASSHSDAPLIKQDPQANLTDVYAFIGTKFNDPSQRVLNVLVSVRPFSDPGDGVIYDRFSDDALYSIHITHPTTGATTLRYDFRFSSVTANIKNPSTILSYGLGTELGPINTIGDARQNFTQVYTVTRNGTVIASGVRVAPPNVGRRVTPGYNDPTTGRAISGATSPASLDPLTAQAVQPLASEVVFAGPREDGFYADTPGIFDLLDGRIRDNNGSLADGFGQDGGGVDGFRGYNVLAYAIQIPVTSLQSFSYTAPFADLANPLPAIGSATGVGVYATVSRQRIRLLTSDSSPVSSGPFLAVNRLGNPLFNEAFVALRDKDRYNRTAPTTDTQFVPYALNPELASLINFVFGTSVPTTGRTDLAAVYIPDVIRVDTTTAPVRQSGQTGFSRFGFFGGDTTSDSGGRIKSGGWPNGRRPGDDVVDSALTVLASGPTYASVVVVGDNVAANDQIFNQVFPYLATPHAGPTTSQRQPP